MDEQRIQAYIALIEQLLNCPQGEEGELLQANAALLDAGLLAVIGQYADWLESQGEGNAQWLRGFIAPLKKALGLETADSVETEEVARFLFETLQLVQNSEGNPKQIYPVWIQQQARFNAELLAVLPMVVAQLFEEDSEQQIFVVDALSKFGTLIQEFPLGTRWLNLELGITAYDLVLQVHTRDAFPERWAMVQNNLATAYCSRIQGNRAENLEQAITAYELALQVLTCDAFPQRWAMTQNNLAIAYCRRIRGNRAENLEQAITAYELVLQAHTRDAFPEDWAMTQNNLAIAYCSRIRGDRAENLEQAIAAYELALQVLTCDAFPEKWAWTQHNLAGAYKQRIRGNRAENLEQAIAAYELTLQVRTRDASPEEWAATQGSLASAYNQRIRGDRAENLEQAIATHQLALQVRTRDAFPEEWAWTQHNLANAYSSRIQGDRAENLEQAIATYELALQVLTCDAFPEEWAKVQKSLANAHFSRIQGDRAENLEQAIATYELALQVLTCDAFPEEWADTQNSLANAYSIRIRGDRVESLEQAIAAYELALQVLTCDAFPEEWAMTQNNLSIAYRSRIRGDRAENLEQALTAAQLALQVRTRDAFPEKWAMTQNNLSNAYFFRIQGDRAENLEQALTAAQLALQVFTRDTFSERWANTQHNLANAYFFRIRGDRAENLEQAITAYELVLQIYTRDTFPERWADTQHNLASAYSSRSFGNRAENLKLAINAFQLALQVYTCETFPKNCRQTSRSLGSLYFEQQNWEAAIAAYSTALAAAEILYQACILLDGKAAELAETHDLPRRLTYALARSGNLLKAVETLEQARARGLRESLDRDRANLTHIQQTRPDLYTQYQEVTLQLRTLESHQRERMTSDDRHTLTPETLRDSALALRQQLTDVLQNIRQVPGYEQFLTLPTFADIQTAVQANRPLVYLVCTPAGSLALIVTSDTVESVWLDALNETQLIDLLNQTWFSAYNQSRADRQGWFDAIDSVTRQLWETLMQPLIHHLKARNLYQAALIPTGPLSFLPLSAAWTEDPKAPAGRHYALDNIHFTYAPNARSLAAAQTISDHLTYRSILAIDNPTQDLPNSEREINAAIASFPKRTVLRHTGATVETVQSQLSEAAIVHFSCHGTANINDPLNSGLVMSDGLLTLRDILALNLTERETGGIRLAILSACETGLSGIENADEVISLPTGLLQAGVAAVIASLWSVSDLSTMLLLTRFYDFWRVEGLEMDQALRQAQQWLRDTTNREKAAYFKALLTEPVGVKAPAVIAQFLYQSLLLRRPNERDFAHPFSLGSVQLHRCLNVSPIHT